MVFRNLPLFHRALPESSNESFSVSVLIPARNEEAAIAAAVDSVLANRSIELEVIVMDDHSSDHTAAIVERIASHDSRVSLAHAPELPASWNGKQHACWQLSQLARNDLLLFLDADVRLSESAIARLCSELRRSGVSLLSGFPNQLTHSIPEKLLVPMMHFLLLGYLPLDQMRASTRPEFGAGCGQLFLAKRADYMLVGGHASIQASRHDGLQLPRAFRRSNLQTDLFDASDIAHVRMYSDWASVLSGLQKNASEGLANPKLIVLFTVLLLGAAVCPLLSFAHAVFYGWPTITCLLLSLATLLSFLPRAMITGQLGQSWLGVALHPLAVSIFVAVQWWAFLRQQLGWGAVSWKGRP